MDAEASIALVFETHHSGHTEAEHAAMSHGENLWEAIGICGAPTPVLSVYPWPEHLCTMPADGALLHVAVASQGCLWVADRI
jgi:hypothetical protein